MKITNPSYINYSQNKDNIKNPKEQTTEKTKHSPAAIYEKSTPEDKGSVYDKVTIEQLKIDSEKHYENLKRMVEDLLKRQGKTFNELSPDEVLKVDETTRAEAKELIGPDGALGIEAVSDSIVQFAKAISGGDPSKLATLRKAIDKGFAEAEKVLGKLPEISQKTYERVMEKLDMWENE